MRDAKAFTHYPWATGEIAQLDRRFPSYLSGLDGGLGKSVTLPAGDTHFGLVQRGLASIEHPALPFAVLRPGTPFCAPGGATITADTRDAQVVIVSREDWHGLPMVGGVLENEGRLKYIDGCTDSLLVPPVKMGDPCLNLLYFPPGIEQTMHTHPSDRIGVILSGRGVCRAVNDGAEERIDLEPGMLFCIHAGGEHAFSTDDSELRVLAYHPESDFGPTDDEHPMLNRTIIDGVSAADESRKQYRTQ